MATSKDAGLYTRRGFILSTARIGTATLLPAAVLAEENPAINLESILAERNARVTEIRKTFRPNLELPNLIDVVSLAYEHPGFEENARATGCEFADAFYHLHNHLQQNMGKCQSIINIARINCPHSPTDYVDFVEAARSRQDVNFYLFVVDQHIIGPNVWTAVAHENSPLNTIFTDGAPIGTPTYIILDRFGNRIIDGRQQELPHRVKDALAVLDNPPEKTAADTRKQESEALYQQFMDRFNIPVGGIPFIVIGRGANEILLERRESAPNIPFNDAVRSRVEKDKYAREGLYSAGPQSYELFRHLERIIDVAFPFDDNNGPLTYSLIRQKPFSVFEAGTTPAQLLDSMIRQFSERVDYYQGKLEHRAENFSAFVNALRLYRTAIVKAGKGDVKLPSISFAYKFSFAGQEGEHMVHDWQDFFGLIYKQTTTEESAGMRIEANKPPFKLPTYESFLGYPIMKPEEGWTLLNLLKYPLDKSGFTVYSNIYDAKTGRSGPLVVIH